jgi:transposase InsO family protein
MAKKPLSLSEEALFRRQVVSEVGSRVLAGQSKEAAIEDVLELDRQDLEGKTRSLSKRTVYRWLSAFKEDGVVGLEPAPRARITTSLALSPAMLRYLKAQKLLDPKASVPEIIKQAEARGIVVKDEVSRTSAWRACRRMGLPLNRPQRSRSRDMRRFAYPHRMMMVLADGKHFRAGAKRLRRVALPILDDATRKGLAVVVAPTESTVLFLQALYQAIVHYGLMISLFLDNGPGFVSKDTLTVAARLGIQVIHGTPAYPQGHGKIERFHRRMSDQLLRGLDGNPAVDPDPGALSLRLKHWLDIYNHEPHYGLDKDSPQARWQADERDLVFPSEDVKRHFVITFDRKVSADNVISYKGSSFEVPRGHAGQRIDISRNLLDGNALTVVHEGVVTELAVLDPVANARSLRARRAATKGAAPAAETAASMRFETDLEPLVDDDGGFEDKQGDNDG